MSSRAGSMSAIVTRTRPVPSSCLRHGTLRQLGAASLLRLSPAPACGKGTKAPPPFGRRRGESARVVARFTPDSDTETAAAAVSVGPALADLELLPVVDAQGYVLMDAAQWERHAALVFAVYDDKAKLQFVGFSKDLRNSLRTVLSRCPAKAYFFRATGLDSVDQDAMLAIREAWFAEAGGAPIGNKLALERAQWQQPIDAGAVSQRGRQAAAEETARQVVEVLRARGCVEEFVPNPVMLADGLVDFMPARALSDDEVEEMRRLREAAARSTRTCTTLIDGHERKFTVHYSAKHSTNGGYMLDVAVTLDGRETQHRVVVGKEYYEPHGIPPETVVEAAMSLLLSLKVCRHTDKLLTSSQYPINYFSITQMEQWFRDEFRVELAKAIGDQEAFNEERDEGFWRFNRINDYGPMKIPDGIEVALDNGSSV